MAGVVDDVNAYTRAFLAPLGVDDAVCEYVASVIADADRDADALSDARDTVVELLASCVEVDADVVVSLLPKGMLGVGAGAVTRCCL